MARLVSHFATGFSTVLRCALALLLCSAMTVAAAKDNYSWPADLTDWPFNCSQTSPGVYDCPSGVSFSKKTTIAVTEPIHVIFHGDFYAEMADVGPGKALLLDVKGNVTFAKNSNAYLDIIATKDITIGMNSRITGDVSSTGDDVTIDKNSSVNGNVEAFDELVVGKHGKITGTCKAETVKPSGFTCGGGMVPSFHHFLIEHEGSGITCAPSKVKVTACSSAATGGTCPATTDGAAGTLLVVNAENATIASYEIDIPAGASSTTIDVPFAGTKTVNFNTEESGATCWDGDAASCTHVYYDAGFDFAVPDHPSAKKVQSISIAALQTESGKKTCAPAFTGTKNVQFNCTYVDPDSAASVIKDNPDTGSRPVSLQSGSATVSLTCGGAAQALDLNFDKDGKALIDLTYTDVGKVTLTANFGPPTMTGNTTFIAYPSSLAVSRAASPPATLVAGEKFRVKVFGKNIDGNVTPNYGREKSPQVPALNHQKCLPKIGEEGIFSGTLNVFKDGSPESDNSTWNEVGTLDILARSTSYLDVPNVIQASSNVAAAPACTGLFGRFRPQYLKTELDQPNAWAYSGQPFRVKVTGFSEGGTKTKNYNVADGFHQDITFSAWGDPLDPATENPAFGVIAPNPVPKSALVDTTEVDGTFAEGAVVGSPSYTFDLSKYASDPTKVPVKPTKIYVRAVSEGATSAAHGEATIEIRSARLRMSNAFGSVDRDLKVPVRVEYWTGSSWLLSQEDNFTRIPTTAIALNPAPKVKDVAVLGTEIAINKGAGFFTLSKPKRDQTNNGVGSVLVALNLGNLTADNACLDEHKVTSGAKLAWLRSRNGTCDPAGASLPVIWTHDPAARASFGVSTPENKATIHVRESFN
jgi:MSHA biogenesis protein MshQ